MSSGACEPTLPRLPEDWPTASPISRSSRLHDGWMLLSAVLDAAEQIHEPDRAVIGRRVTLLEEEGESVIYTLVFPGDGDPAQGWISADSPLGSAVLGCRPGDTGRSRRAGRTSGRHRALRRVAGRMLSYMTSTAAGSSPLAVTALALVQDRRDRRRPRAPVRRGGRRSAARRRRGPA